MSRSPADATGRAIALNADGRAQLTEAARRAPRRGEIGVEVSHSSLNYKDALVVTGQYPTITDYPRVPGIDLVGHVSDPGTSRRFRRGERVLAFGHGLGTDHDGGYTELSCLPAAWLESAPVELKDAEIAAIGTAGLTAALAVRRLSRHGVRPRGGPVLVTGAAGGTGSFAVMLLAALGHRVIASTGRRDDLGDSLRELGAHDVIDRLTTPDRAPALGALSPEGWAGAIDTVGGATLTRAIDATAYGGVVIAIGMAQSDQFTSSVLPFISRAISLVGVNSVHASTSDRRSAWTLLTRLDRGLLSQITEIIALEDVVARAPSLLAGRVHGRLVVDVRR